MAEGEILEEEAVTPEEEATIPEAVETQFRLMTNYRDNNPQSLKAIAESLKHLCRNGPFIEASINSPLK